MIIDHTRQCNTIQIRALNRESISKTANRIVLVYPSYCTVSLVRGMLAAPPPPITSIHPLLRQVRKTRSAPRPSEGGLRSLRTLLTAPLRNPVT